MAITRGKSKIDRRPAEDTGQAAARSDLAKAAIKATTGAAGKEEGDRAKAALAKRKVQ